MTRRSKLEIFIDILMIIQNGTNKPTRIMYGANLSWKHMQKILKSMVFHGLLREIYTRDSHDKRTKKRYEITPKGAKVVRYFNRRKNLIEPLEIWNLLY